MRIIFDKTEYDIKPMTIGQYQLIQNTPDLSDVDIISLFTDLTPKQIKQAPFQSVKFVAQVLRGDMPLLDDKGQLELTYEFKGTKYGLIQPSKISFEEWINLEVFFAQKPLNLSLLATHLYKPLSSDLEGDERELIPYDMVECMKRSEEFKDFPIKVFLPSLFFFTTFAAKYTELILSSLGQKATEKLMNLKNKNQKK